MRLLLLITIFISTLWSITALRCYTCSAMENDVDQRCVTDPDNVEAGSAITDCNKKYCYSIRIEYLDPKDVIQSMLRSCADVPPVTSNQVTEDGTHRIYYRVCQTDLCNGGSGKGSSGGNLRPDLLGEGFLLVPGKGNTAPLTTPITILTILSTIILYVT